MQCTHVYTYLYIIHVYVIVSRCNLGLYRFYKHKCQGLRFLKMVNSLVKVSNLFRALLWKLTVLVIPSYGKIKPYRLGICRYTAGVYRMSGNIYCDLYFTRNRYRKILTLKYFISPVVYRNLNFVMYIKF